MQTKFMNRAMCGWVGAAALLLAGAAQAVGVSGQGTWETTLKGRDGFGKPVAASSAEAVFLYDTTLDVTWLRDANYVKTSGHDADGLLDWDAANAWASTLTVGSFGGWRLPRMIDTAAPGCETTQSGGTDCGYNVQTKSGNLTKYEVGQTVYSEMAHLFYVTLGNKGYYAPGTGVGPQPGWGLTNTASFENLLSGSYSWSSLESALHPREARAFFYAGGYQGDLPKWHRFYAVAVRPGDVAAVPEPQTWALLLLGLGAVMVARRRPRQGFRAFRAVSRILRRDGPSTDCQKLVMHRGGPDFPRLPRPGIFGIAPSPILAMACVVAGLFGAAGDASAYTFTDLGALRAGGTSEAQGINRMGQVVGFGSSVSGVPYQTAIVWTGTTPTVLSATVPGAYSAGFGINSAGQVAGHSGPGGRATRWDGLAPSDLNGLGTGASVAYAINDAGRMVGYSERHVGGRAVLWNNSSTATDLGTLGGLISFASGINEPGQVVGWAETADRRYHAALWNGRTPTQLGELAGGFVSKGFGINDDGQVVGVSATTGYSDYHAALWNGTTPIDLGVGTAADINNHGVVVGWSGTQGAPTKSDHAILWKGTQATDLNSFLDASVVRAGWYLRDAKGINDSGWIAGTAVNRLTGETHAYVLSVPEPQAGLLMSAGLCLIGVATGRLRIKRRCGVGGARALSTTEPGGQPCTLGRPRPCVPLS